MFEIDAREQRRLHIDDGHVAGPERHADGAGGRFGIEHAVHGDGVAADGRALEPEGAEEREFLASRFGGLAASARARSRRILAARDGAEEGRALDDREIERPAVAELGDAAGSPNSRYRRRCSVTLMRP